MSDFPRGTLENCFVVGAVDTVNAIDTDDAVGALTPIEAVLSQRGRHS